ncbi:MAG TPA: hypothetical protein PKE57_07950, partial [Cellvibrionaceae bacterium]|nr:hypothetical protein [Cellvibrionaceae bacterium]
MNNRRAASVLVQGITILAAIALLVWFLGSCLLRIVGMAMCIIGLFQIRYCNQWDDILERYLPWNHLRHHAFVYLGSGIILVVVGVHLIIYCHFLSGDAQPKFALPDRRRLCV